MVAATLLQSTLATPESASNTVPAAAMGVVNALRLSGGEASVSTGGARSMFTAALTGALLPARSVATPSTSWLNPSVDTDGSEGHVATPDSASLQVK